MPDKKNKVDKKTWIIRILQILERYSNKDHGLSVARIVELLEKDYEIRADRKTVRRTLEELEKLDYKRIKCNETMTRKNKNGEEETLRTGWYVVGSFDETELRLLVDCLAFAKHIYKKQKKQLIEKIESLSGTHFAKQIKHIKTLDGNEPQNAEIFTSIEVINEAIESGKKITFQYCDYGTDKKLHPRADSYGVVKLYEVNPYQMVWTNGRYYLLANSDKHDDLVHFRIDRMKKANISIYPIKPYQLVEGMREGLDLTKHMAEHIYMFGGESGMVTFTAKKYIINDIIDWFGNDVSFLSETEDEITASVRVNYHAMKYWAMQYGHHVTVTSPPSLVEKIRDELTAAAEKYKE